ncbi:hypothetical protein P4H67_25945 [Paenibacillus lautus]|uniref:hypothetical protein n=1 Tax=Paenibacillus lautus TaxID=1401 RepID=UPI002DBDE24B|nr:hypothetical protein [Paenibacillus lautus]MEC0310202.1 hypothetical protein [Paenibacillus lautus]
MLTSKSKQKEIVYANHLWKVWSDFRYRIGEIIKIVSDNCGQLSGKALILGAGYGNDVPIEILEELFEEVLLVDIDEESLVHFIKKTSCPEKFKTMSLDLTGFYNPNINLNDMSNKEILEYIRNIVPSSELSRIEGSFDFIMNCNYTTQLISYFSNRNVRGSVEYTRAINELSNRTMNDIFVNIERLLKPGGILLHSTDLFELSFDKKTGAESIARKILLPATDYNLDNLYKVIDEYFPLLQEKGCTIMGSIPPKESLLLFNEFKSFFIPWKYDSSDRYEVTYVAYIKAWKSKKNDDSQNAIKEKKHSFFSRIFRKK